ncbi:MAG: hypothetical protein IPP33_09515 [Flavobacteriales bacterium]|nr:hypothetical protein [Flavobacteriales bacterium]
MLKAEGSGEYAWLPGFEWIGPDLCAYSSLPPGNYWLMHRLIATYSVLQGGGCTSDSILITIPDLGPTCGSISGSTYMDYNSDCVDTEVNAMNVVVGSARAHLHDQWR